MRTAGGRYPPRPPGLSRVDLIVMDDGFQHRYVRGEDQRRAGRRHTPRAGGSDASARLAAPALPGQLHRAHYFIVTKCPEEMNPLDQRIMHQVLIEAAYQNIYFTRMGIRRSPSSGKCGRGALIRYGGDPDVGNRQSGTVRARRLQRAIAWSGAAIRRPSRLSGEGFEDAGGAYPSPWHVVRGRNSCACPESGAPARRCWGR